MSLDAKVVRSFNSPARIYTVTDVTVPPTDVGEAGSFIRLLNASGESVFGPKTDEATWPAVAINKGPPGDQGVPGNFAPWTAGAAVANGQAVYFGRGIYVSTSAHTASSSFHADLKAGRWVQLGTSGRCETIDPDGLNGQVGLIAQNRMYLQRLTGSGVLSGLAFHPIVPAGNAVLVVYRNNGSEGFLAAPAGDPVASTGSFAVTVADGDWVGIANDNNSLTLLSSSNTTKSGDIWRGRAGATATFTTGSLTVPTGITIAQWGVARGHYIRGVPA